MDLQQDINFGKMQGAFDFLYKMWNGKSKGDSFCGNIKEDIASES